MATIKWLGGSSTASATATNWKGGSIPGANDVALFDNEGLADCAWTLTSSGTLTVSEIVIESTFEHQVILNAAPVIKGLYLNGILNAGSLSMSKPSRSHFSWTDTGTEATVM